MRSKPLDLVEGEFRAGSNNQEVVWHAGAVRQLKRILFRMDLRRRDGFEVDPAFGEGALKVDLDIRTLAPIHRHPWVGRDEMVFRFLRDDCELIAPAQLVSHFISHDDAAKAGAKHYNVGHFFLPLRFLVPPFRLRSCRVRHFVYSHIVIRKYKRGKGINNLACTLRPIVPAHTGDLIVSCDGLATDAAPPAWPCISLSRSVTTVPTMMIAGPCSLAFNACSPRVSMVPVTTR